MPYHFAAENGEQDKNYPVLVSVLSFYGKTVCTIVNDLVEKIVVHQAQGVGKSKTQQLEIHYNFVGVLEVPEVAAVPNSIMIDTRQGVAVEYITRKAG